MHINADASGLPAEEARKIGTMMIHYLTDYVFDGAQSRAYQEQDRPGPINLHGHRKLAGEQAGQCAEASRLILRTSWICDLLSKNFLLTVWRPLWRE